VSLCEALSAFFGRVVRLVNGVTPLRVTRDQETANTTNKTPTTEASILQDEIIEDSGGNVFADLGLAKADELL
jgi:hypothetical protein